MLTLSQFGFKFGGAELIKFGTDRSSIFHLFTLSCPSKIVGFIHTVIINTIKRAFGRSFFNISNKIGKIIPSFANFYTATTIVFVGFVIGIVAATAHISPCSVKRVVFSISSQPMTIHASLATARMYMVGFKITDSHNMSISTITLAEPECLAVIATTSALNCDQSSKSLVCDIYCFGHRTAPIGSRSSGGADASTSASLRIVAWD